MVDQESVRPLAKSAAAKAKHTPAPGYEIVARAITGDEPPAWLVIFLKMWGPCLAVDRGVAAVKLPTRAHMRKPLEGVRAAAALILSALDDGETRGFLDAASPGTIPDRLAICRLMSDLVRRAGVGPCRRGLFPLRPIAPPSSQKPGASSMASSPRRNIRRLRPPHTSSGGNRWRA